MERPAISSEAMRLAGQMHRDARPFYARLSAFRARGLAAAAAGQIAEADLDRLNILTLAKPPADDMARAVMRELKNIYWIELFEARCDRVARELPALRRARRF